MARRTVCCLSLLAASLVAVPAFSQETGEIAGAVTDATGAALPGVLVTLEGTVLLQPQTAVTGSTGAYRFPRLGIGTYDVRFALAGFRTLLREGIKVEIGFTATVNAELEIATVSEVVTVKGDSPILDLRDTSRSGRFTRDALDRLPTPRDPFAVIAQTPGVLMSAVNVGGNLSAQQSGTVARGDWSWNNTWTLDGVDITDLAAIGASSIYYDFGSFEELRITTGGTASQQTSGIGINMVTRSGTDTFRGSARLLVTDDDFEAQNVDDALRLQGAGAGNPIKNIRDAGIEAGGPLRRGRAWFWASYGRQDVEVGVLNFYKKTGACQGLTGATAIDYPLDTVHDCMEANQTTIWAANVKAQVRIARGTRLSWFTNLTEKVSPRRGASDLRPTETTGRQSGVPADYGPRLWKTGPASIWKVGGQHIVSDGWLFDLQWAHQGSNFAFDFNHPSLADEQPRFEITTREWSRSFARDVNVRPVDSVTFATEHFRPSALGGDHTLTAGWRWRSGESYRETHWGGNTIARYRNGVAVEAELYRDAVTQDRLDTQSAWIQDTYTRRRLTLNLGLRWDRQHDAAEASTVPAHPFQGQMTAQGVPFKWLPSLTFGGADGGPVWNDLSPRAGISYDLFGDGRTTLKAMFARYFAQRVAGWFSSIVNPVTEAMIRFPWRDTNADGYVQPGELDTSRILFFSGNYSPYEPERLGTDNWIDPDIENYKTDEVLLSIERQVGPEFALGAAYTWRRYFDASMYAVAGLTSADYVRRSFTPPPATCPASSARCPTVEYWEPSIPLPSTLVLQNRPDYERRYQGFEVTARKRLRNRWMLDGSFAFNDARQYYRSPRAYQDPTNVEMIHAQQYAVDATNAGNFGIVVIPNAKWVAKIAGAYTLPWTNISLAGVYQARQGYPFFQQVLTPSRANSAGVTAVQLDPVGDVRYPALHLVDLGVQKAFRLGRLSLTASVDAFNVANVATVLARRALQNSATANQVSTIVAPRVIRLGVRTQW